MLSLIVNGFALAVIAMLTAATLTKFREAREAARWPRTPGRIVKSAVEARSVVTRTEPGGTPGMTSRRGRAATEVRNFAAIAFDYTVGGKRFTGTRVSIAADPGNTGVAETLARYPAGKKADVYYDPANPGRSVLEPGMPDGAFQFMALLIAFLVVADIAVNLNVGPAGAFLTGLVPVKRFAGAAVFLGFMGIFVLVFAAALWRQAAGGRSWRAVEATIVDPSTRPELLSGNDRSNSWTVYQYEVDGVTYTSDSAGPGEAVSGYFGKTFFGLTPLVRSDPRAGRKITVYADPANPAHAVRSRGYGNAVFVAIMAAGLLGAAIYLGGFA